MRLGYLSIPLIALMVTVPMFCIDVTADVTGFDVYESGSSPEKGHQGPLVSTTVDFQVTDDYRLSLPKGTVLSGPSTYMRLDADDDTIYRIGIGVRGMSGFISECGMTFEFYDGRQGTDIATTVTINNDGTVYSGMSFASGKDYGIRIVTSRTIILDEIPESINGMIISFDVTIGDNGSTVIEEPTGNRIVDLGNGSHHIDTDDLSTMRDPEGRVSVLIGGFRLVFDRTAAQYLISRTEGIEMDIDIDDGGDTSIIELTITSDGGRITSLNGGTVTVTLAFDSGSRYSDVVVRAIASNGRTAVCDSSYDYDSSELTFTSGDCYLFSVGSPTGKMTTGTKDESNGTGMFIAIPIAITICMILLPLALRWRGKI